MTRLSFTFSLFTPILLTRMLRRSFRQSQEHTAEYSRGSGAEEISAAIRLCLHARRIEQNCLHPAGRPSLRPADCDRNPRHLSRPPQLFQQVMRIYKCHFIIAYLLCLPYSDKLREDEVESIILNLGLKKSKATPVGDAKTRGLSGGEKKRLSIGNELVGCDSGRHIQTYST